MSPLVFGVHWDPEEVGSNGSGGACAVLNVQLGPLQDSALLFVDWDTDFGFTP